MWWSSRALASVLVIFLGVNVVLVWKDTRIYGFLGGYSRLDEDHDSMNDIRFSSFWAEDAHEGGLWVWHGFILSRNTSISSGIISPLYHPPSTNHQLPFNV